ncbi:MAG: hypothetical protein QHJ73_09030 [Armatimonadota bacterium]|nr:hypothetical protein [Armatimonadota bacterium]
MKREGSILALAAVLWVATAGWAGARESQLAGVRLGRPQSSLVDIPYFAEPTRIYTGALPGAAAGGMAMPGMEGAAPGMEGMSAAMPGMEGMSAAMPGMEGMMPPGMDPTMMGMPGATPSAAGAGASVREKFQGRIAGQQPEQFAARLITPPATSPLAGTEMQAALGPGGMPMDPAMSAAMPGMEGTGGAAAAAPQVKLWIYEKERDGVTFMFGFTEEGRINLICVGDDKPHSVARGGRKPSYSGAKTSKGIGLGDTFKSVILAYGFPESTEVIGDQVLVKYWERHGVAFTFRQNYMRVSSIAIKSPDE